MFDTTQLFGLGFLVGLGFFIFFIGIAMYLYSSLAFMAIAKKARYDSPGIAWIPGFGPAIIANRISKMSAWPFFLLIAMIIPILNIVAMIAFAIFYLMWMWKTFEAVKRPGWWAIPIVVPIIGPLVFFILVGIAAWGK